MFKYLVLLMFLTGCGGSDSSSPQTPQRVFGPRTGVAAEFLPYVYEFERYFGRLTTTPINFALMTGRYTGVCMKVSTGMKFININQKHWRGLTEEQKEQLIFHELGHCELNKMHFDGYRPINGTLCPRSIMKTFLFGLNDISRCYSQNRDYYIQELFRDTIYNRGAIYAQCRHTEKDLK